MGLLIKIISVVGARPNFIKLAPLDKEFSKYKEKFCHKICHTGQHFDEKMSKVFFEDLDLPEPDYYLGVGSGSHAVQTAKIIIEFEKVLIKEKPDLIIVYGDVNSTMACSIVASKLNIKIAHVESGLRSFDRRMPEEINRIITDKLSDLLFVSEESGLKNLAKEGIDKSKIFFVGNIMIDSLVKYQHKIDNSKIINKLLLKKNDYVLATFHRPSNVDSDTDIKSLINLLNEISNRQKIIFPVHPRTLNKIDEIKIFNEISPNIIITNPLGYFDFLCLIKHALTIITDSGGVQEESTFMNVQCITMRDNTERPVTIDIGTNQLAGSNHLSVKKIANNIFNGNVKNGQIPKLWDGKTASRIINILLKKF